MCKKMKTFFCFCFFYTLFGFFWFLAFEVPDPGDGMPDDLFTRAVL